MLYTLIFLVPCMAIILMISMPLVLKHNPAGIGFGIGKLQTADIRKLNGNQLKDLRRKTFLQFLLATMCTVIIGFLFITSGYGILVATENAVIVGIIVQIVVMCVLIYPILKKAKLLKFELEAGKNI